MIEKKLQFFKVISLLSRNYAEKKKILLVRKRTVFDLFPQQLTVHIPCLGYQK